MIAKALKAFSFLPAAYAAGRYSASHTYNGRDFDLFGRRLGKKLLAKGKSWGARFLLHPVSSTRYWEFPFVLSCMPSSAQKCLDVSSPNLFSLFFAQSSRPETLVYINPDERDAYATRRVVNQLGLSGFQVQQAYLQDFIKGNSLKFDAIWSISVIEHINGDYEDTHAVRDLYQLLAPGGRLIITIPTDKKAWDEYRSDNVYELDAVKAENSYFFQRFYTPETIRQRIIESVGIEPGLIRWWGENKIDHFHSYIREWQEQGLQRVIGDVREFQSNYKDYAAWEEMPGVGVCGLMFEKPLV